MGSHPRHREETEAHGSAHRQGARRTRRCPASPPNSLQEQEGSSATTSSCWAALPWIRAWRRKGTEPGSPRSAPPWPWLPLPPRLFPLHIPPHTPSRQVPGVSTVTLFLPGSSKAQPATVLINKGRGVAWGGRGRRWKPDPPQAPPL